MSGATFQMLLTGHVVAQTLVDRTQGTHFGNMTVNGGNVAFAFDGNATGQAQTSCVRLTGNPTTAYCGTTWSSGKIISGCTVYASNNAAYQNVDTGAAFNVLVYGKNGTPANSTDGTLIATIPCVDSSNNISTKLTGFVTTTAYTDVWCTASANLGSLMLFAEIVFYENI